jgi:hypothetical protein
LDAEAGGLWIQGLLGQHSKTLSPDKQTKKKKQKDNSVRSRYF